jgi:hypothetical protein
VTSVSIGEALIQLVVVGLVSILDVVYVVGDASSQKLECVNQHLLTEWRTYFVEQLPCRRDRDTSWKSFRIATQILSFLLATTNEHFETPTLREPKHAGVSNLH